MRKDNQVTVSLVLTCYNLGGYIGEMIESVESQSFKDWELIIVNDGSTEAETNQILTKIAKRNPHYTIINQRNMGLATARNNGIKVARGKYVVCIDADDKLHPDFLARTIPVLENDSGQKLGVVTTYLQEFGERENVWKTQPFNPGLLLAENVIHGSSVFRKVAWEKVGGYNKNMKGGYEDWNFWISIVEKGYEWAVVKEILFYYRIRRDSMLHKSKELHLDLYQTLVANHRQFINANIDGYTHELQKVLSGLRADLYRTEMALEGEKRAYEEAASKREEEVHVLSTELFALREEMDSMWQSKIVGNAIRLRKMTGRFLNKARKAKVSAYRLPMRAASIPKRVARKILPTPLKKWVVSRLKSKDQIRYETVASKAWRDILPLVSIVVPYFNQAKTIGETIDSALNQTFKDFEIIIVNDGSTDQLSIDKLQELEETEPKVRIIHQANQKVATARNTGLAEARGKYLMCLDSDDMIDPTYLEKAVLVLETSPDIALVTPHMDIFGVAQNRRWEHIPYDPLKIYDNNMVITAAVFKREAWLQSGGYKRDIGYEDWELWLTMAEKGFWGKLIPEGLFKYRTALSSGYLKDKENHKKNIEKIHSLHPWYRLDVEALLSARKAIKHLIDPQTAFINLDDERKYETPNDKPNILIAISWMTFGGAETLIYNYCMELRGKFNLSFVTGLASNHEWEYKFKEITPRVYHLANLFDDPKLYLEFVSNYIRTRKIDILHIIHTSYAFDFLSELKKRHPDLKVVVTMFNDRADHFGRAMVHKDEIDVFTTDNQAVGRHYRQLLGDGKGISVIPNGINNADNFNPALYERDKERESLKINKDDLAVFFIGRLSEEKNPDVFIKAADLILNKEKNVKFFVIGDGPMRKVVEKLVRKTNNEDVKMLGYQSEIARFLSAADVFVLPSSIEGFPLSILEAMAMGVVTVASKVGAIPDVIQDGENGFLVTPGSEGEIADTVIRLRKNPKLLSTIKEKSRRNVEESYSNEILGENYTKLYKEVLE